MSYDIISNSKETYRIKEKCPILNDGVKEAWEIQFFWMNFNNNVYTNHVSTVSFDSSMFLDYILRVT